MPLAVTHILTTIILVGLYRDHVAKHKRYFTLHTLFIAGFAGLLPDIDFALRMVAEFFNFNIPILLQHGGLAHTPIFGLIFLIPAFIFLKQEKHKKAMYFFVITFGILFHIFLDYFLGGGAGEGVMWLWPISTASFKIHLISRFGMKDIPIALDAILLLGWLWYIEVKHRISDFI
ncbi:metal-dependent hydrolase [Candidatus Woesearchaeota archaeon]|nr:metal-dependent hydrolase [Candidatus Woesearchaeota archaeon]